MPSRSQATRGRIIRATLTASWGGLLVPLCFSEAPRVRLVEQRDFAAADAGPCFSPQSHHELLARASRARRDLISMGMIRLDQKAAPPKFIWPLRQSSRYGDPGFDATANFVDHDPRFPGFLLDYAGGERTYDLALGYNHTGTDIVAWPFGWTKLSIDQVEVVAAAAGTIVDKLDGYFDRECTADFDEQRQANLVIVAHQDGSLAAYGHLKKNSLTTKPIGAWVEQGEVLGLVGSSGYSSYPHLHFEIVDAAGHLNDPFKGPYNDLNQRRWWRHQPPYFDPALLRIMTHSAPPLTGGCRNRERTFASNRFRPGDEVYFAAYYRDLLAGQESRLTVYEPDGNEFTSWLFETSEPHSVVALRVYATTLPHSAAAGLWSFRAEFQGTDEQHVFAVGDFEDPVIIRSVRPANVPVGTTRHIKIRGRGFAPEWVPDIQSRDALERRIEITQSKIKERRIVLTVRVPQDTALGPRDIVLTAPDYTQVVVEEAFSIKN